MDSLLAKVDCDRITSLNVLVTWESRDHINTTKWGVDIVFVTKKLR